MGLLWALGRSRVTGGVRLVAASMSGGLRTESHKTARTPVEQQCFERMLPQHAVCDNLINALKLLTSQQKDGDSPVGRMVPGLVERSRSGMMGGLRKCSGQSRSSESWRSAPRNKVQESRKAKVHGRFPRGLLIGKAHTQRAHEEGVFRTFIDTSNVGDQRWEPPPVDADCYACLPGHFPGSRRTRAGSHVFTTARTCTKR